MWSMNSRSPWWCGQRTADHHGDVVNEQQITMVMWSKSSGSSQWCEHWTADHHGDMMKEQKITMVMWPVNSRLPWWCSQRTADQHGDMVSEQQMSMVMWSRNSNGTEIKCKGKVHIIMLHKWFNKCRFSNHRKRGTDQGNLLGATTLSVFCERSAWWHEYSSQLFHAFQFFLSSCFHFYRFDDWLLKQPRCWGHQVTSWC